MQEGPQFFLIPSLLIRLVGVIVCVRKAKKLNRNLFGWGVFGLISPIIAMIWVHNIKPKKPMEIENIIDYNEVNKE